LGELKETQLSVLKFKSIQKKFAIPTAVFTPFQFYILYFILKIKMNPNLFFKSGFEKIMLIGFVNSFYEMQQGWIFLYFKVGDLTGFLRVFFLQNHKNCWKFSGYFFGFFLFH
jgi:hypothetical protein